MTNVVSLEFPKCVQCGARATHHVDLVGEDGTDAGKKHFCAEHGHALTMDDLCLLIDKRDQEIAELRREIAAMKSALRS